MSKKDFTTTISVNQSPEEVFNAINNVRGWWSEGVDGTTDKVNAEFDYHYQDIHVCKLKIIELVPNAKVVWHVVKNHFNFTKDEQEWTGTKIYFEITRKGGEIELRFTHVGLVPEYECFEVCREGWTNYIESSLHDLITTGRGAPNPKEGGFNQQLIDDYNSSKKA